MLNSMTSFKHLLGERFFSLKEHHSTTLQCCIWINRGKGWCDDKKFLLGGCTVCYWGVNNIYILIDLYVILLCCHPQIFQVFKQYLMSDEESVSRKSRFEIMLLFIIRKKVIHANLVKIELIHYYDDLIVMNHFGSVSFITDKLDYCHI